jgi:hypothetical protein
MRLVHFSVRHRRVVIKRQLNLVSKSPDTDSGCLYEKWICLTCNCVAGGHFMLTDKFG